MLKSIRKRSSEPTTEFIFWCIIVRGLSKNLFEKKKKKIDNNTQVDVLKPVQWIEETRK